MKDLRREKKFRMPRLLATTLVVAFCFASQAAGASLTASYYTIESCMKESGQATMANGKRLQDHGVFTAAMWDVPFGTCVLVRNLTPGKNYAKEVIVTITDRGPAKRLVRQGRIIDLNYEAMRQLGGIRQGVIPVEIEILK